MVMGTCMKSNWRFTIHEEKGDYYMVNFSEYLLAQKKMLVRALPDHRELVTSIRGNADASMSTSEPAML